MPKLTERGGGWLSAGIILALALNILLTVFHYGQLTQRLQDLSERVRRLERTIDTWRDSGSPIPVHPREAQ